MQGIAIIPPIPKGFRLAIQWIRHGSSLEELYGEIVKSTNGHIEAGGIIHAIIEHPSYVVDGLKVYDRTIIYILYPLEPK